MIAKETLTLINKVMIADQGASFRRHFKELIPHAADVFREEESPFRSHLGASILGKECARDIWYSFRWATRKKFDGRILRLFNRGHLEEPRMVALLKMIGCEVWASDNAGKQFRINTLLGYFQGSLDGVVKGIPECPDEPLLGEFKTHNDKSFNALKESGIIKSKWTHYIQTQMYMGEMPLRGTLYMAVNKDTDELHAELIGFDSVQYRRYKERAQMIINSPYPPPRISKDRTFFLCKFCDHREVCHGRVKPERTCRSCHHAIMTGGGKWHCKLNNIDLDHDQQEKGCREHFPIDFKTQP